MRILVVDDLPANRRLLVRILQRRGHETVEAVDGPSALEQLAADPFDLVFMDMLMPGMTGAEATRHARAAHGTRMPIIGVTGLADEDARAACLEAGMDAVVTKPVSVAQIDLLVDEIVTARPDA